MEKKKASNSNTKKNKKQDKKQIKGVSFQKVKAEQPIELFYMSEEDINVKTLSKPIIETFSVQVWPDLSIMEIELENKNSIDFVMIDTNYWEGEDIAYLQDNQIKSVFAVTVMESDCKELKRVFELIKESCKGRIVFDSDNFEPFCF